jgi:hypothetical protein
MELTRQHRESMIAELKIANQELVMQRIIWDKRNKKSDMPNDTMQDFEAYLEVKMFLIQQRIETIEKALIDNEIDF